MKKEIIVYLDDYKYSGDGYYDTIYLDFRSSRDFNAYWQVTSQKVTHSCPVGSYLQIDGYRSPKRLVRGAYYALNIAVLAHLNPQLVPNSLVFAHYYDFRNYEGPKGDTLYLLQNHEPLDPTDFLYRLHRKIETLDEGNLPKTLKYRVHNVSQANWNEILNDDEVLLVYDIGAPIHATKDEVYNYIEKNSNNYAEAKPILILSHWDIDHYHCLLGMTEDNIKANYRRFICPDKLKSCTSQRVYLKMEQALGTSNINCLALPPRTKNSAYPKMHNKFSNQNLRLYVGEASRNINYSGVILYAEGSKGNVIFGGDSLLVQASDVLAQSISVNKVSKEHHLIVPHHGGDINGNKIYKTYNIPHNLIAKNAIISVDEHNNPYGHPSVNMLLYLASIANWKLQRTDKQGCIGPIDLS